jgi:hypothetical protein
MKSGRTRIQTTPSAGRLLFRAFVLSLLLNALMSGAGTLSEFAKPLSFLGYISQAIAAPSAFLVGHWIRPSRQSLLAIVTAGIEGFLFSLIFYTIVAWIALTLWLRYTASKADSAEKS